MFCRLIVSYVKGTKNSFLIKRPIQVPSSGSCTAKAINKYISLIEVRHYTLSNIDFQYI